MAMPHMGMGGRRAERTDNGTLVLATKGLGEAQFHWVRKTVVGYWAKESEAQPASPRALRITTLSFSTVTEAQPGAYESS